MKIDKILAVIVIISMILNVFYNYWLGISYHDSLYLDMAIINLLLLKMGYDYLIIRKED